jgi:hypothetical protein
MEVNLAHGRPDKPCYEYLVNVASGPKIRLFL